MRLLASGRNAAALACIFGGNELTVERAAPLSGRANVLANDTMMYGDGASSSICVESGEGRRGKA